MATNEDAGVGFEESDLISLGRKLASLELNDAERAALAALISDDDVAGFARFNIAGGVQLGFRRASEPRGIRAQGFRVDGQVGPKTIGTPKPGRF